MDEATPPPAEITRILHEWQGGSREALDRLIPLVYNELQTLASRQLAQEWRHNRLQTTVVVNEAYMKLFGQREVDWQNRGHFFAIAAKVMRRILVDHARRELREKQGGGPFTSSSPMRPRRRRLTPSTGWIRWRSIARSRSSSARSRTGPHRRTAFLRRADRRRNRRCGRDLSNDGEARVGDCQGVALSGADAPARDAHNRLLTSPATWSLN